MGLLAPPPNHGMGYNTQVNTTLQTLHLHHQLCHNFFHPISPLPPSSASPLPPPSPPHHFHHPPHLHHFHHPLHHHYHPPKLTTSTLTLYTISPLCLHVQENIQRETFFEGLQVRQDLHSLLEHLLQLVALFLEEPHLLLKLDAILLRRMDVIHGCSVAWYCNRSYRCVTSTSIKLDAVGQRTTGTTRMDSLNTRDTHTVVSPTHQRNHTNGLSEHPCYSRLL